MQVPSPSFHGPDTGKELLLPAHGPRKGGPSGFAMVVTYIVSSITSSVLIVLCIKGAMVRGFSFPLTLNWVTYVFAYIYFAVLERRGVWSRSGNIPRWEVCKLALSSVASISFMNLCLKTNTVAIYQICKFAVIPCTLVLQKLLKNLETNWRVLLSLSIVLSGVGYSTMKGFGSGNLSAKGLVYAGLAVVSTSVYRLWQGTKQKEYKVEPFELQGLVTTWQVGQSFVAAVLIEFLPVESQKTVPNYLSEVYADGFRNPFPAACSYTLGACIFAVVVNFTSYGLIGKTGPIAYAVVGHAKTVLTIICGMVLFPKEDTQATINADIIGCGVAMIGVIAYTHFEYCLKRGQADLVERCFPSLCTPATSAE